MELCNYSAVRELLESHGFRFSKALGQNFLTAAWVPQQIAESVGMDKSTGVLEVGPGIGCLTEQLAMSAGRVVSVELDGALKPVLEETLSGLDNVEVVFGDVLTMNISSLVSEKLSGLRPVFCANLPYNITSPVLSQLLESRCFDTLTVMIQREVARRICAAPGTGDYSAFTIFVNWYAEPELLFDVSPDCFVPRPKVWSSVLRLKQRESPPVEVRDEKVFFRAVRASFNQRRKTLINGLSTGFPTVSREELTGALCACGLDEKVRGETLDIAAFAAVADRLSELEAEKLENS